MHQGPATRESGTQVCPSGQALAPGLASLISGQASAPGPLQPCNLPCQDPTHPPESWYQPQDTVAPSPEDQHASTSSGMPGVPQSAAPGSSLTHQWNNTRFGKSQSTQPTVSGTGLAHHSWSPPHKAGPGNQLDQGLGTQTTHSNLPTIT